MLVGFRPQARLRGPEPVDLTTAIVPVVEAPGEGAVDLAKARVVSDRVQAVVHDNRERRILSSDTCRPGSRSSYDRSTVP